MDDWKLYAISREKFFAPGQSNLYVMRFIMRYDITKNIRKFTSGVVLKEFTVLKSTQESFFIAPSEMIPK